MPVERHRDEATGEIYLYDTATGERRWEEEAGQAMDDVQWTSNAALDAFAPQPTPAMSPPFRPAPRMLPAPPQMMPVQPRPTYVTQPTPSPVRVVAPPPQPAPQVLVQQPPLEKGMLEEGSTLRLCMDFTYRSCVCCFLIVFLVLIVLIYERVH